MNLAQLENRILELPALIGAAEDAFNLAKDDHASALYDLGMETAKAQLTVQTDGKNEDTRRVERAAGIANHPGVQSAQAKQHGAALLVSHLGAKLHMLTAEYDAILTVLKRHTPA